MNVPFPKPAADSKTGVSISTPRLLDVHKKIDHQPPASTMKSSAVRVLVVDDNRDAAYTLSMLIRIWGHEVQTAYDGAEAVAVALQFRPQLILLDIGLPRMNGYDTARAIRAEPWGNEMSLIAVTGSDDEEDVRQAIESGFNRHMVKPVDPAALEQLLVSLQPQA